MYYQIILPHHWSVQGSFPTFDPNEEHVTKEQYTRWLTEDLWSAMSPDGQFIVDIVWYPAAAPQGEFIARLVQNEEWTEAREVLQTASLIDVLAWTMAMVLMVEREGTQGSLLFEN